MLGDDAPGDVDHEVALTLPSQRPTIIQDSEVEIRECAGVLETVDHNAVDHASPPDCAKVLRDIVFRTHLDVPYQALPGDPPARKKPGAVRFHSGARVVRAKPPPEPNRLRWSAVESCPHCRSVVTTRICQGGLGAAGEGEQHQRAGVARVLSRNCRPEKRAQGARAEDGSEAGTRTAVWARFYSYCDLGRIPTIADFRF